MRGPDPLRVLVTRPLPGAAATAARLEGMGHEAVILPLTRTVPLPAAEVAPEGTDLVAVTSANAVRHAPPGLIAVLRPLPFVAVGGATADSLRSAGIADVTDVDGDAADLARAIVGRSGPGSRVLYLCGRVRRPDLEAGLTQVGLAVDALETYDTVDVDHAAEALERVMAGGKIDAVLVHSANAARRLSGLLESRIAVRALAAATFCCISSRVADALRLPPGARVMISYRPNEDGMLRLVGNLPP